MVSSQGIPDVSRPKGMAITKEWRTSEQIQKYINMIVPQKSGTQVENCLN